MSFNLGCVISFHKFCTVLEDIQSCKSPKNKQLLQNFIKYCRSIGKETKLKHTDRDVSLFPIYSLLLPKLSKERKSYNLKAKTLSQIYADIFLIKKNTAIYKHIQNPQDGNDYGEGIARLLSDRFPGSRTPTLWVNDVHIFLDLIASDKKEQKVTAFNNFVHKLTLVEFKWLTRLILKDLKLGLNEKDIFAALHPSAQDDYNFASNLREVCDKLSYETDTVSDDPGIKIFSPFRPMLLEKREHREAYRLFKDNTEYYVQTKYDGERLQIHMKDGVFKYFTKKGHDITHNTMYENFLTKKLAPLMNPNCKSIIMDGEIMGWHKAKKKFGSKGGKFDIKKVTPNSAHQPCFVAYDILLYNDQVLCDTFYFERFRILKQSFTEEEGVLKLCQSQPVSNALAFKEIFTKAVENHDEGLAVKKANCFYYPNQRQQTGCYKVKAEYSKDLVNDFDFLILGGFYNVKGNIGSLLVGVADTPKAAGKIPEVFIPVGRVKSGLRKSIRMDLMERLSTHWRDNRPSPILEIKNSNLRPDKWIHPQNSVVITCRATELVRNHIPPLFCAPSLLRLCTGQNQTPVRYDKSYYNIGTKDELMNLLRAGETVSKCTKKNYRQFLDCEENPEDFGDDEAAESSSKRLRLKQKVPSMHFNAASEDIIPLSRLFEGKNFFVENGNSEYSVEDLERLIRLHSGSVVQVYNPDSLFCFIIGCPDTLRIKNALTQAKYNIIYLDWLIEATKKENLGQLLEFSPMYVYSLNKKTESKLADKFDKFHDNYCEHTDRKKLEYCLDKLERTIGCYEFSEKDYANLDRCMFKDGISPFSIFRGIRAFFDSEDDTTRHIFLFMSGKVTDKIEEATYAFFNSDQRKNHYKDNKNIAFVKSQWLKECYQKRQLIEIENFLIHDTI